MPVKARIDQSGGPRELKRHPGSFLCLMGGFHVLIMFGVTGMITNCCKLCRIGSVNPLEANLINRRCLDPTIPPWGNNFHFQGDAHDQLQLTVFGLPPVFLDIAHPTAA